MTDLVVCSHGTRSAAGAARVTGLVGAVAAALPSVTVREAHVDVHPPFLDEVITPGAIVVPLLLAPGYHVHVDIAQAASRVGARVAAALGPDELLTSLLGTRLAEAALEDDDVVVLAAAGSSVPGSDLATRAVARSLASALGRPVHVAYGAACAPRLDDLVAQLRSEGGPSRRIVAASYLLAPGHFHERILASGVDAVTNPLLDARVPDPRLIDLVVRRFRERLLAEAVSPRVAPHGDRGPAQRVLRHLPRSG